jgi:DNA-binding CsgD family transcriptional regulator
MTALTVVRNNQAPVRLGPVRVSAGATADAVLARATSEVLVMSTLTVAAKDSIGLIRQVDHENLRRGVRYRMLVPDPVRTAPVAGTQLARFAVAGAAIRTMPKVPSDAIIVDRRIAVLPVENGLTTLQLPSVVNTTIELFERVWSSAVPLTPESLPDGSEPDLRERELLTLLFNGCTDVVAAARLDVSVRTVRRMVADLMNRLGARSRFQAGAKAADRGWLLERAS